MRRSMKFIAAVAAAALPAVAGAQAVRVAGYGQGCYYLIGGPVCTVFTQVATSSSVLAGSNLVYTGGNAGTLNFDDYTSDGFIGIGGMPDNFGQLRTNSANFNYGTTAGTAKLGFRLLVSFIDPMGVMGVVPVNAVITGSTSTTAGGVFYNFDNTEQGPFSFTSSTLQGGGAGGPGNLLTFSINDLSVLRAQTASVTGNVTLELTTPEPASLGLLATGIMGLGLVGYRRRRAV